MAASVAPQQPMMMPFPFYAMPSMMDFTRSLEANPMLGGMPPSHLPMNTMPMNPSMLAHMMSTNPSLCLAESRKGLSADLQNKFQTACNCAACTLKLLSSGATAPFGAPSALSQAAKDQEHKAMPAAPMPTMPSQLRPAPYPQYNPLLLAAAQFAQMHQAPKLPMMGEMPMYGMYPPTRDGLGSSPVARDSNPSVTARVIRHRKRNTTKRYQCDMCPKKFHQRSNLITHIRTHTGEKPFACSHAGCSRSFSQSSNLRRHMRIHERERGKPAKKL